MRINEDYIDDISTSDLSQEEVSVETPEISGKCVGKTDNKTMRLKVYFACSVIPDFTKNKEEITLEATNLLKRITNFLEKSQCVEKYSTPFIYTSSPIVTKDKLAPYTPNEVVGVYRGDGITNLEFACNFKFRNSIEAGRFLVTLSMVIRTGEMSDKYGFIMLFRDGFSPAHPKIDRFCVTQKIKDIFYSDISNEKYSSYLPALCQLRNPIALVMGISLSDVPVLKRVWKRLEDYVFNKTASSRGGQRIDEDYIDVDDDLTDVSDSVPVDDSNKTREDIEREFFSGKWPLFLRIQCCIGRVVKEPSSDDMKMMMDEFLKSVRKFLKICPFIDKISDDSLYASEYRDAKNDDFWSEHFADEGTYNFNGVIGFKVSRKMTKQNIFMFIESLWKLLKNIQNELAEGYGLYFDIWYVDDEPGVIKKLSHEYDVKSPIFYKQRFVADRDNWNSYDEIIMMSYVMLDQDMTKEEQKRLCLDAIAKCDRKVGVFDKLKRYF